MNTLKQPTHINVNWRLFYLMLLALFVAFYPELALANKANELLPTGSLDVPGAGKDAKPIKIVGYIIRIVVFLFIVMAMGFGLGTSIFTIFGSINDARQKDEWGSMMKQIIGVLVALAFAIFIYTLANKYVIKPIEAAFV